MTSRGDPSPLPPGIVLPPTPPAATGRRRPERGPAHRARGHAGREVPAPAGSAVAAPAGSAVAAPAGSAVAAQAGAEAPSPWPVEPGPGAEASPAGPTPDVGVAVGLAGAPARHPGLAETEQEPSRPPEQAGVAEDEHEPSPPVEPAGVAEDEQDESRPPAAPDLRAAEQEESRPVEVAGVEASPSSEVVELQAEAARPSEPGARPSPVVTGAAGHAPDVEAGQSPAGATDEPTEPDTARRGPRRAVWPPRRLRGRRAEADAGADRDHGDTEDDTTGGRVDAPATADDSAATGDDTAATGDDAAATGDVTGRDATAAVAPVDGGDGDDESRRRRWRTVARTAAWASAIVAVAVVLLVFVFPTRTYLSQRHQLAGTAAELQLLTRQNAQLSSQVAQLQTDAEIERLAREEYHLVRPGERAFAILPTPTPPTTAAPVRPAAAPSRSILQRLTSWIP